MLDAVALCVYCLYLQFAIRLLDLATLSLENDMASPFHICGVVIPKLVYDTHRLVVLLN